MGQGGVGGDMKMSPEQIEAIANNYLQKQESLVQTLKTIVEHQRSALEALGDDDEEYGAEERHAVKDANDEQLEKDLTTLNRTVDKAVATTRRSDRVELTQEEAGQPDIDFSQAANDDEEGRAFAATKPWLGQMKPPTDFQKDPQWDTAPDVRLELQHVYGYRARSIRNNIALIDDNRILYHAAGVGIVHNISTNTQTFFMGHDDDIICLDYHPSLKLVATGQLGKNPSICIWKMDDPGKCLAKLQGFHKRAVAAVAFSGDGVRVASVGMDDDHSVAVYNWKTGQLEATSKGDTNPILHMGYNSTKTADINTEFVTVGVKHIQFWRQNGGELSGKRGLLGNLGEAQAFLSVNFTPDYVLVSTKSGSLYMFRQNKLKSVTNCHTDMCATISCDRTADGQMFTITGGAEGVLNVWDGATLGSKAPQKRGMYDMNQCDPTKEGKNAIRATWMDGTRRKMLVGTATSSIYLIDLASQQVTPVVVSHFADLTPKGDNYGELWGLTVHPTKKIFGTAGEDSTLRIWDMATRKQLARLELGAKPRCCAWHPSGRFIGVGLLDGRVMICASDTGTPDGQWEILSSIRKSRERVQVMAFSPDGTRLACGSEDRCVLFFDVSPDGALTYLTKGIGPSSCVNHLDWSKDSKYIQTDSQAYELLFYNADGKRIDDPKVTRDCDWAEQTCTLGWNVQGIWQPNADGTDVNMVRRSHNSKYLACAEDTSFVRLFNFPCIGSGLDQRGRLARRPMSNVATGHSEHVTNVVWSQDDDLVVSTGGADLAIMQWKVVRQ